MIPLLPARERTAELADAVRLAKRPPWVPPGTDRKTDRGLRATVRRYDPAFAPTPEIVFALGERLGAERLGALSEAAVHRLAVVAHLLALMPDDGRTADSVGRACARAGMLPSRFARLADTAHGYRVAALARAFRQVGASGGRLSEHAMPGLLDFLFAPNRAPGAAFTASKAVTRWAQDFFITAEAAAADASESATADA